ncbi:MAG: hypothetical protein WCA22_05690 [Candidatus Binatus sp.]
MASVRQIKANRRNALQSTGPRSAEGKARVSSNALKHGLTGRDVVLPNENPDEYESFRADLLSSLDPQGALEGALAEKIVVYLWRLRRVPGFEATFYRRGFQELLVKQAEESVGQYEKDYIPSYKTKGVEACDRQAHEDAKQRLARAKAELEGPSFHVTRVLEKFSQPLSNLWRHEAALFRSVLRMLHELERLQARRAGQHVPVPEVVDVDVNVPAPAGIDIEETGANGKSDGDPQ